MQRLEPFFFGVLATVLASGAALAESAASPAPAPDYGDHRCYWSPADQQERGDSAGPWHCNQVVGVSGNHMTLNGQMWRSRGVTLQAFVRLHNAETQINYPEIYAALTVYGPQERAAIRAFDADTIRFQVSQPSLDPQSSLYRKDYVDGLVNALKKARQDGFVVMIMMQDQAITGEPVRHPLPIEETLRDWYFLNSIFKDDRGVLYELYNEPNVDQTTAGWTLWKNGGGSKTCEDNPIGMQTMVRCLRAQGSKNVFVLDGVHVNTGGVTEAAATLEGLPQIDDPLGCIVYAVHPYPHGMPAREQDWDVRFGNASRTIPVDADEWSAKGGVPPQPPFLGLLDLPTYDVAVRFLNYVGAHTTMSLGAGAFDIPDFMTQDVTDWKPTNYDKYSSSDHKANAHLDAGKLVHTLYKRNYKRLTCDDGVIRPGTSNCTVP